MWCIYDWGSFHRTLFASSLLGIINTLLDQTRQDDIQVIGCETLFDFVNNQVCAIGCYLVTRHHRRG
jgi:hypothetical protein